MSRLQRVQANLAIQSTCLLLNADPRCCLHIIPQARSAHQRKSRNRRQVGILGLRTARKRRYLVYWAELAKALLPHCLSTRASRRSLVLWASIRNLRTLCKGQTACFIQAGQVQVTRFDGRRSLDGGTDMMHLLTCARLLRWLPSDRRLMIPRQHTYP